MKYYIIKCIHGFNYYYNTPKQRWEGLKDNVTPFDLFEDVLIYQRKTMIV